MDTSYLTVNPFTFTSFRERWMGCLSGSVFPTTSATQLVFPLDNVADVEAIKVG